MDTRILILTSSEYKGKFAMRADQKCIHGRMECDGHDVTMRCDVEAMQVMLQKRKKKLGGGITSGTLSLR